MITFNSSVIWKAMDGPSQIFKRRDMRKMTGTPTDGKLIGSKNAFNQSSSGFLTASPCDPQPWPRSHTKIRSMALMDTSSRQEARVIIEGRGLAIAIMEAWMRIIGRTMPFIFTKLTQHCKYRMRESGMRTHCHAPWKSLWVGLIFGGLDSFFQADFTQKVKTLRVLRACHAEESSLSSRLGKRTIPVGRIGIFRNLSDSFSRRISLILKGPHSVWLP